MNFRRTIGIVSGISVVHYGYILIPATRQQIQPQHPPQLITLPTPTISPFRLSDIETFRFDCALAVKNAERRIRLAVRLVQLTVMFTPAMLTLPVYLLRTHNLTKHMDETWWPYLLTATVQYAGPSFIKVNQQKNDLYYSSDSTLVPGQTSFLKKYAIF